MEEGGIVNTFKCKVIGVKIHSMQFNNDKCKLLLLHMKNQVQSGPQKGPRESKSSGTVHSQHSHCVLLGTSLQVRD